MLVCARAGSLPIAVEPGGAPPHFPATLWAVAFSGRSHSHVTYILLKLGPRDLYVLISFVRLAFAHHLEQGAPSPVVTRLSVLFTATNRLKPR